MDLDVCNIRPWNSMGIILLNICQWIGVMLVISFPWSSFYTISYLGLFFLLTTVLMVICVLGGLILANLFLVLEPLRSDTKHGNLKDHLKQLMEQSRPKVVLYFDQNGVGKSMEYNDVWQIRSGIKNPVSSVRPETSILFLRICTEIKGEPADVLEEWCDKVASEQLKQPGCSSVGFAFTSECARTLTLQLKDPTDLEVCAMVSSAIFGISIIWLCYLKYTRYFDNTTVTIQHTLSPLIKKS